MAALSPPRDAAASRAVFLPRLLRIFGTSSSHEVPFTFRGSRQRNSVMTHQAIRHDESYAAKGGLAPLGFASPLRIFGKKRRQSGHFAPTKGCRENAAVALKRHIIGGGGHPSGDHLF